MDEYEEEPFGNATWRYNNVGGLQIRVRPVLCVRGVEGDDALPNQRNAFDKIDVNAVLERHRGVSDASRNTQNTRCVLEHHHHHEKKAKKKSVRVGGESFR